MAEHEATTLPIGGAVSELNVGGGYVEVVSQNIGYYAKFLVPLISAALITFTQLSGHGSGWFMALSILVAAAQAYATYQFPANEVWAKSLKFWINVVGVVAQAILAVIGSGGNIGDITSVQWATIGLAILTALGVVVIPNGAQYSTHVIQAGAPDARTGVYGVTNLNEPPAALPVDPDSPFADK